MNIVLWNRIADDEIVRWKTAMIKTPIIEFFKLMLLALAEAKDVETPQ